MLRCTSGGSSPTIARAPSRRWGDCAGRASPPTRLQFVRAGTSVPIGASITDEELSAAVETRSAGGETVVVASLVSRHFDFLDGLVSGTLQKDDGRSIGRALHTA